MIEISPDEIMITVSVRDWHLWNRYIRSSWPLFLKRGSMKKPTNSTMDSIWKFLTPTFYYIFWKLMVENLFMQNFSLIGHSSEELQALHWWWVMVLQLKIQDFRCCRYFTDFSIIVLWIFYCHISKDRELFALSNCIYGFSLHVL